MPSALFSFSVLLTEVSTVEEGEQPLLLLEPSLSEVKSHLCFPTEEDLMAIDDKCVEAGKSSPVDFNRRFQALLTSVFPPARRGDL